MLELGFGVSSALGDVSLADAKEFFSWFSLEVVVCVEELSSRRLEVVEDEGAVAEDSLARLSSRFVILPWSVSIWR
jgi:hypothetical protein